MGHDNTLEKAGLGGGWPAPAWGAKRATIGLILMVLAVRVVYLVWLCPYELAPDEAHYWEWSRHLDLSYYTKGPGVAWLIAGSTALFGVSEWAVRLPVAVMAAIAALALARLAVRVNGGDERMGLLAAALFSVAPFFFSAAQFMTIDGPYIAFWILTCYMAWRVIEKMEQAQPATMAWVGVALCMGLGFLCKYTILLLAPGLIAFFIIHAKVRRVAPAGRDILLAGLVFLAVISPVIIWNQRYGWPTLAHLLGHTNVLGGDFKWRNAWCYEPRWTISYLATPFIAFGPVGGVLFYSTLDRLLHHPPWRAGYDGAALFLFLCSVPVLGFYLVFSLVTEGEMNWSIAGFTTMLILILPDLRFADTAAASRERRHWRWLIGTNVLIAIVIAFGGWAIKAAAGRGEWAERRAEKIMRRVSGHDDQAREVEAQIETMRQATGGREPMCIAMNYGTASLLAFYMQGRPRIYCANHALGGRLTAYDYFSDTDLYDSALHGRPAIVIGSDVGWWKTCFNFDKISNTDKEQAMFAIWGYRGPKTGQPARNPGRRPLR